MIPSDLPSGFPMPWMRMAVFLALMLACVLVPFALWGDRLDQSAPQWLLHSDAAGIALVGVGLLIADVVLPIPSSVVSMALCWQLGPIRGGICVAAGVLLAFVFGYGIGRLIPEPRLRQWIGPPLWDSAQLNARSNAMWWIALARPLPVLAEISALLAGVWRIPFLPALANAAAASSVVGALYGLSAWLGRNQPALGLTLLALLVVPGLSWLAHRILVRRWVRSNAPASTQGGASS